MKSNTRGFSLVELLVAVVITLGISSVAFTLFQQNDRTFRDQSVIAALQQNVRAVSSQIVDELRMAGQGSPVFCAYFDPSPVEASQTILNGSSSSQILFRSGLANINSTATVPLTYTLGTPATVTVGSAAPFNTAIGGATGRFVYLFGKTPNLYGWVRANVTSINTGANTITLTPSQTGGTGGTFASAVTISLEEGVSYRLSGGSILRGRVSDFTNVTSPTLVEETVGTNFTSLQFTYYDQAGAVVTPSTLADRARVWRVDLTIVGQASQNLSNGTRPTFGTSARVYPRNLGVQ